MKNLKKILVLVLCMPFMLWAQDASDEKDHLVELSYMKAKIGMEAKFEAAVKAHNAKFHKEGAYESELYAINTGNEAGWYVWTMGSFTYTDLDSRPTDKAHTEDWDKNIAPYIAEYGRVEIWKYSMLSARKEVDESMISLWYLDIKRGEFYRFQKFMKDVAAVYKEKGDGLAMYTNEFHQTDGRDVALVWPLVNWADFDKDDWKMKEEFEKLHGEGSWENGLEEWEAVVVDLNQEVWRIVK